MNDTIIRSGSKALSQVAGVLNVLDTTHLVTPREYPGPFEYEADMSEGLRRHYVHWRMLSGQVDAHKLIVTEAMGGKSYDTEDVPADLRALVAEYSLQERIARLLLLREIQLTHPGIRGRITMYDSVESYFSGWKVVLRAVSAELLPQDA